MNPLREAQPKLMVEFKLFGFISFMNCFAMTQASTLNPNTFSFYNKLFMGTMKTNDLVVL